MSKTLIACGLVPALARHYRGTIAAAPTPVAGQSGLPAASAAGHGKAPDYSGSSILTALTHAGGRVEGYSSARGPSCPVAGGRDGGVQSHGGRRAREHEPRPTWDRRGAS